MGDGYSKLNNEQREILRFLTKDFLTVKQIAKRRQTSTQSVYKTIKILRRKGVLSGPKIRVAKNRGTLQPLLTRDNKFRSKNGVRLHGQEFNIKLLNPSKKYNDLRKSSNLIYVDGNTVKLFKSSVEIYSSHVFFADDEHKATSKSFIYWNRFFHKLENAVNVILIKDRYQNIKLVKSHYSLINNELAKDCENQGERIRIYCRDDGKLWFVIDNSFNLHELETVHPETAKHDMHNIKRFFDDLKDNPVLPSEIMKILKEVADVSNILVKGQLNLTKTSESLIEAVNVIMKYLGIDNIKLKGLPGKKSKVNEKVDDNIPKKPIPTYVG